MPDKFVVDSEGTVTYLVDGAPYTLKYAPDGQVVSGKDSVQATRYYVPYTPKEKTMFRLILDGELVASYSVSKGIGWAIAYTELPEAPFSSDGNIYYTNNGIRYKVMSYGDDGLLYQVKAGDIVQPTDYILQV